MACSRGGRCPFITSYTSWLSVNIQYCGPAPSLVYTMCVHLHQHCAARTGLQWDPSNMDTLGPLKCVLIRGVSSFQGANNAYLYEVRTGSSVLIREVSSFQGCPLRGVPLYSQLVVCISSKQNILYETLMLFQCEVQLGGGAMLHWVISSLPSLLPLCPPSLPPSSPPVSEVPVSAVQGQQHLPSRHWPAASQQEEEQIQGHPPV